MATSRDGLNLYYLRDCVDPFLGGVKENEIQVGNIHFGLGLGCVLSPNICGESHIGGLHSRGLDVDWSGTA